MFLINPMVTQKHIHLWLYSPFLAGIPSKIASLLPSLQKESQKPSDMLEIESKLLIYERM
ncbi:MAG: hypothetical protein CNF02_08810 [OM182 bacterium MED-G28]|uniref:Uncharacterized protein n=1 Tax=OM182 bacterium MED-G28 TaxID=1986256 RepID=A0A2A5WAG7_9GAMM|nr:MAG: hypothetical protein CNF02_08810 [OM182 bacterium MED-G28]